QALRAVRLQALALRRGAPVLPHDRAMDGASRAAIPEDDGLALVRDSERGDVARPDPRAPARLAEHSKRDAPDLLRVVLDPARLRIVLRELRVGTSDDASGAIEDQGRRPRGSLIDRDDAGLGHAPSPG